MVKRREPKTPESVPEIDDEKIEAFAAGVDGAPQERFLDPDANHDFKALRVPFNEYEWTVLEDAARKTGRTKNNYIRWAITEMSKDL